ncbi:MAG: trigger factor [Clostridiales bacterium]|jgi:trigger factor|nr:trigger factor [Clostridiales bacterium]
MASVETIDQFTVNLTFNINAEEFESGLRYSYNKNKNRYNIQGFRKGKAPRPLIEKAYGENVFFDDAVNFILPQAYERSVKETKLNAVAQPSIKILSISKEEGAAFSAEVTVVGEAAVDEYYALTYKKYDPEPSDAEIQRDIDRDRDKNARIVTVVRPVQNGDIVTIDFDGVIDGKPFDGGHAEDFRLTIGGHTFIDTFEEQLIGAETGENIFVRVTFPEDYNHEKLAGKPAVFDVKIKEIQEKQLPDMDDDFAQDVSEFETFDEYREDIIKKLRASKERDAKRDKEDQVMSQLVSKTNVDLPPIMIENSIDEMIRNFSNQLKYQGITLDDYLRFNGQTNEQLRESYREHAIKQLKTNLALEAVAKKENLTVSGEEINEEIDRIAAAYGMSGKQKSGFDADIVTKELAAKKAFDFIMEQAIQIA